MSQGKKNKNMDQMGEQVEASSAKMAAVLAQWRRERPDIDPTPMAICGEVWRAGEILRAGVIANLAEHDLDLARFDVLLTLRRQGRDKSLSPSALAKEMWLSTSAMTNRLDRLEKRGLLERIQDPNDRRGLKIMLTAEGFALADTLVVSHVNTEANMLSGLTSEECKTLRNLLKKVIV